MRPNSVLNFNLRSVVLVVSLAFVAQAALAQDEWPKPSKESQAYSEYRTKLSMPLFSVSKVKALIKKIKTDNEDNMPLNDKVYYNLSLKDQFAYTMLHAENYSQNCDAMPPIMEEEKKIFSYLPSSFSSEASWSDRQTKFLATNRTQVIAWLREAIKVRGRVGINFKQAIWQVSAKELIPDVLAIFKKSRKDKDILTLTMLLMKDAKYAPFINSSLGKKFYGDDANYMVFEMATKGLEEEIMYQAMNYSRGK